MNPMVYTRQVRKSKKHSVNGLDYETHFFKSIH